MFPFTPTLNTHKSGHIYSREAIVTYLLNKTQEMKQIKNQYHTLLQKEQQEQIQKDESQQQKQATDFLAKDQGVSNTNISKMEHSNNLHTSLKRKINVEDKDVAKGKLLKMSYWLSEAQPQYTIQAKKEDIIDQQQEMATATRPSSPFSGQPLRLKDLVPITLMRDTKTEKEDDVASSSSTTTISLLIGSKCLCAVSNKIISTQSAIVIKKTGVVMLEDVYNKVIKSSKNDDGKTMNCPITGKKFKEKDVLKLHKCSSGFAASGNVVASKYKPTLT
jgi:nitric oxide synthase-interacting protein